MSSVIDSSDLDKTCKDDKSGSVEELQCSSLENPTDHAGATETSRAEVHQEGIARHQEASNAVEEDISSQGDHKISTLRTEDNSNNNNPEADSPPMQDQECQEVVVEQDVSELNEISNDLVGHGDRKSSDNEQQLGNDNPVTHQQHSSNNVIHQGGDVSDSKLNDREEKSNSHQLEKDIPMEADDQLYDYLFTTSFHSLHC